MINSAVLAAETIGAAALPFAPGTAVGAKKASFAAKLAAKFAVKAAGLLAAAKLNSPLEGEVFSSFVTRCTRDMRACWAESDL